LNEWPYYSPPQDAPAEQAGEVSSHDDHDQTDDAPVDELDADESDVELDDTGNDPVPVSPFVQAEHRPKQTRIIAMMNQKGGVGKTTTAANLAAALVMEGMRVLTIDMDPQAHLSLSFGVEIDEESYSLYDLLSDDDLQAEDVICEIYPGLTLLPSEVNLAGIEGELAPKVITGQAQRVLKDKLKPILSDANPQKPDFVIIDCPPSLGLLTINALTLANEVIVPMQAHFLALQGLSKLLETVQLIRNGFNANLVVSGIILCMHDAQTILAGEVVSDLKAFLEGSRDSDVPWKNAVIYHPYIRRNIKLAESPSFGKTIFEYAPTCPGARDYEALADSVLSQSVMNG
jgi:chromosome partitioning protein